MAAQEPGVTVRTTSLCHSLLPYFLCCSLTLTGFPQPHFASSSFPDPFSLYLPVPASVTCRSWSFRGVPALAWVMVPQGCQYLFWHEGISLKCVSIPSLLPASLSDTFASGAMRFPARLMPHQGLGGWWLFPGGSSHGWFSMKSLARTAGELPGGPWDS